MLYADESPHEYKVPKNLRGRAKLGMRNVAFAGQFTGSARTVDRRLRKGCFSTEVRPEVQLSPGLRHPLYEVGETL